MGAQVFAFAKVWPTFCKARISTMRSKLMYSNLVNLVQSVTHSIEMSGPRVSPYFNGHYQHKIFIKPKISRFESDTIYGLDWRRLKAS